MFAISHAATALVLERRYPEVPMPWLLLSVQASELLWVVLNLMGVESTTTEPVVHAVGDIHLAHMPFSHSALGAIVLSIAGAAIAWIATRRARFAAAIGLGVASHFVLDVLTHAPDLALHPGSRVMLGIDLYGSWPLAAFALELGYGVLAWRIHRGDWRLLAAIVFFNVTSLSFFVPGIPGPEELLAGRPTFVVLLVAVQIVVTLTVVGLLRRRRVIAPAT
ncbi:metal-dependent hydrolase [Sandaracinus amylolyticus]|uniref:metal-dependent hydrolase n=1 Tax=Sandaracinus amylolyticus TaxID=927083 RepID=UPI001F2F312D|nr:metal-dependent hydrolase [Sandaracinus amylolyticus]UJR85534.1 Hypothetical protein I5071_76140 [Sandaracinus amylolyticus]